MKPIHIIRQFGLDKYGADSQYFHRRKDQFLSLMTDEFLLLIETDYRGDKFSFKNTVDKIRQKWDSVSAKTNGVGLSEHLWKAFYAKVIIQTKKDLGLISSVEEEEKEENVTA